MARPLLTIACLIAAIRPLPAQQTKFPAFDYQTARTHELKPHRRSIPTAGVTPGFNQLHLTLTISPTGDVLHSEAGGDDATLKHWPNLKGEIDQWRFTPFEQDGHPITAEVEEYVDLVPPERLPKTHITPPVLSPTSKVAITLQRSGCLGSCPSYTVDLTTEGITFDGSYFVVAAGKHTAPIEPDAVRKLARQFIEADFYSMQDSYRAGVTDCPTYVLQITINGHRKRVLDYVGEWEGMPAVVTNLEDEVDALSNSDRWIKGTEGLVPALASEHFNFQSHEAQLMLKEASRRGKAATVQEFLEAGVPLKPLDEPKLMQDSMATPFDTVGWLQAGSSHPEILQVLIKADASKNDQSDKDLALVSAARSGSLDAVKQLIADGANPNADLSKLMVTESSGGMTMSGTGAGSILNYAAESGNPDVVREILKYHPDVEKRGYRGRTPIFSAVEYRSSDIDGARVECVRLLAAAGANVNARDDQGNTPLHETFLTGVEEELLKLGANVNARNNDGETPIFTTVDAAAIALYAAHGADFTLRNNKGQTALEAAEHRGPLMQEAILKAMQTTPTH